MENRLSRSSGSRLTTLWCSHNAIFRTSDQKKQKKPLDQNSILRGHSTKSIVFKMVLLWRPASYSKLDLVEASNRVRNKESREIGCIERSGSFHYFCRRWTPLWNDSAFSLEVSLQKAFRTNNRQQWVHAGSFHPFLMAGSVTALLLRQGCWESSFHQPPVPFHLKRSTDLLFQVAAKCHV